MSRRRFRPTDAFVDESIRGRRYLMGCVLIEARHLASVRRAVVDLVVGGKRLHFHQELDATRRAALGVFAELPIEVHVVSVVRSHGVTEFEARNTCLAKIVEMAQERRVPLLTIESRQDDRDDLDTIVRYRQPEPRLIFDHRDGAAEPMLWIADGVLWSLGAGGRWMRHVEPLLRSLTELGQ